MRTAEQEATIGEPVEVRSDGELLHEYVGSGSERAFTELVQRHLDLVHAAAFRQCNDRQVAEEVATNVFLTLIKKAGALREHATLSGWLFTTARFIASNARAFEQRRREWVQRASVEVEPAALEDAGERERAWQSVGREVDRAVAELSALDRTAVLLRFYENKSYTEIAAALGVSEEAARKRTDRALEKLRERLRAAGIGYPGAVLVVLISSCAIVQAPPALLEKILRAATNTPRFNLQRPFQFPRVLRATAVLALSALIALAFIFRPRPRVLSPIDIFYEQSRAVLDGDGASYTRHLNFRTSAEEATAPLFVNSIRLRFRLKTALVQRFGTNAFTQSRFSAALDAFETNQIARATVTFQQNSATLHLPWGSDLPFVRKGPAWKFDFYRTRGVPPAAQYRAVMERRNGVIEAMTENIPNGRYARIEDAFSAFREQMRW